tara:strand:- start:1465 stop:2925 length:1461 start_codon:yes stop_codon:yes gene_type:complete
MIKNIILISLVSFCHIQGNNNSSILTINEESRNETIFIIDSQTHIDYGLSYPITYEFIIPEEHSSLRSYRKFQNTQDWSRIIEKTSEDFFNGIEAVRFDYEENIAYVSIGLSDLSDSIFIKFTDNNDNIIDASYSQMSDYYDNRDAVVTSTADDWAGWNNDNFIRTCRNFRSHNLWLSCAIITNVGDPSVWDDIQNQLDSGYVEVVSHSRTHPYVPYENLESEVLGSKQDLIDNLDLPEYNTFGDHEYIYAWVAPYGQYDQSIDSMVSAGNYLIVRMTDWGENWFSEWNQDLNKYYPIGASIEVGSSSYWGSTDITELNSTFDTVLASGGIYHLMCHPNILEWEQDFTSEHLEHISNRKNIWYIGFGHLYAYNFLQTTYPNIILGSNDNKVDLPGIIKLYQNYPNPFNPITNLSYDLPEGSMVNITIFDMMGRVVRTLVNEYQPAGYKVFQWDAFNNKGESIPTGIYLYTIKAKGYQKTKKMVFLK